MIIKEVVILVELENGNVHQVLASMERKMLALNRITDDDSDKTLKLSDKVEDIEFLKQKL